MHPQGVAHLKDMGNVEGSAGIRDHDPRLLRIGGDRVRQRGLDRPAAAHMKRMPQDGADPPDSFKNRGTVGGAPVVDHQDRISGLLPQLVYKINQTVIRLIGRDYNDHVAASPKYSLIRHYTRWTA